MKKKMKFDYRPYELGVIGAAQWCCKVKQILTFRAS